LLRRIAGSARQIAPINRAFASRLSGGLSGCYRSQLKKKQIEEIADKPSHLARGGSS